MQLLSDTTISGPASSTPPLACAKAMLEGMPPVMWFIRRNMRRHRTHGLSVPQFRTLLLLNRYPTASLSLVAENLGASLPTASRIVAGLVTKKFVIRNACTKDRRQVELLLTARGRTALNAATRATEESVAREITALTDQSRANIVEAMRVLSEAFTTTNSDTDSNGI